MPKSLAMAVAVLALIASAAVAQQHKESEQSDAAPVVTKYDRMEKQQLQNELKRLQREVLAARTTGQEAKQRAKEASSAYKSALDDEKPDALLRMLEAQAGSRKPMKAYSRILSDFQSAKRAYSKLLLAE